VVGRCTWHADSTGIVVYWGHQDTYRLMVSEDRRTLSGMYLSNGPPFNLIYERTLPRDPYRVLGISRKANQREIEQAYHYHSFQCNLGQIPESEDVLAAVEDAYAKLSDPDQRQVYDHGEFMSRRAWLQAVLQGSIQPDRIDFYSGSEIIVSLTSGVFSGFISGGKPTVVQFYAPWCPISRSIVSLYKRTGAILSGEAMLGAVSCENERRLCIERIGTDFFRNAADFPVISLFKDGEQHAVIQRLPHYSVEFLANIILRWTSENKIELNPITADL